ncbi:MAG TPA: TetR/AcrR family transcriptional regulator [Rhizomicrobium sp.]|nr:TetR/AcrR family transcriptional regulator [Rhizomicrobium sp.]
MTKKRWRRRREARAPEILEAALACFAQKGFAGTRMDDIARKCGITKGTIYLYFDSKESVFKALARASIGEQLGAVRAMVENFQGPSAQLLRLVLSIMGGFVRTSDRVILPKMILAEAGNFPELAKFWREEIIEQGITLLGGIIQRGTARGEFRAIAPEHAVRLCIAPILLIALWRTTFAQFDARPYDHEGLIEAHLQVLLQGLEARPG